VPPLGTSGRDAAPAIVPSREVESAYYLRLRVADQPGVLRELTSILAALDISVEAILQKEPKHGQDATIAIITSVISEQRCQEAMVRMKALPFLRSGMIRLHVEHFD
jgi:homoserine dehydrogenase